MLGTLRQKVIFFVCVVGHGLLMANMDWVSSTPMRVLRLTVAGTLLGIAFLCVSRRDRPVEHRLMLVLGLAGFVLGMTMRSESSSLALRALFAGVGTASLFVGVAQSLGRPPVHQ